MTPMPPMAPMSPHDTVEMAVMGLETAVVAPLLVMATGRWPGWRRLLLPAVVSLPVYVVLHAAVTIGMSVVMPGPALDIGFNVALIVVSVGFWLPVLVRPGGLGPAGAGIYLLLAMPSLDLAGVVVVLRGDPAGGLAMIIGMLPMGLAAVALWWRWIVEEERLAGPPQLERLALSGSEGRH
jgi:hypothetical protein